MSVFNERFRLLKDEKGLSAKDLALQLDIAPSTLSYYLNNREPNFAMLIKISTAFGVTADWLIGKSDSRTPTYAALENEIFNKYSETANIPKEDISPLTSYKDCYLDVQNKIIEFISYFYSLLLRIENLEKLHPDLDFYTVKEDLTYNFIEALEYQIDFVDEAHMLMLDATTDNTFKYYFNSLSRIDLLSQRYKLFVANILKYEVANQNENSDKLTIIADFIKHVESYGKNHIDNIELSSHLEKIGLL